MANLAIYPGSFDPVTLGHLSVIKRASGIFDELEVIVVHNPKKKSLFSAKDRIELLRTSCDELGISGLKFSTLEGGLLATHAKKLKARAIIKGLRTSADLDYELQFASMNRELEAIETVFLATEPEYSQVSSSLIREVASLGGDVSKHVTSSVASALAKKLS